MHLIPDVGSGVIQFKYMLLGDALYQSSTPAHGTGCVVLRPHWSIRILGLFGRWSYALIVATSPSNAPHDIS
jgi:hypothetical protein